MQIWISISAALTICASQYLWLHPMELPVLFTLHPQSHVGKLRPVWCHLK